MQEVLPHFKGRGDGHIVNVSSMLGRIPNAMIRSAYCGAKHFLNALTATFREEIQQTHPGIQISLVSPGIVHTNFGLNAMHGGPDSRSLTGAQTAEEVAQVIAGVIDSRAPTSTRALLPAIASSPTIRQSDPTLSDYPGLSEAERPSRRH